VLDQDDLPVIEDAYVGFLNVFSFKGVRKKKNKAIDEPNEVMMRLREVGQMHSEWPADYASSFDATERFLFPENLISSRFRLKLENFQVSWASLSGLSATNPVTDVEVFLMVYPKTEIAILMFHMNIRMCTTDDLIFIRQLFERPSECKLSVKTPPFLKLEAKEYLCLFTEVCGRYLQAVKDSLCENPVNHDVFKAEMFEIREITLNNGHEVEDRFFAEYPQQIYGLLTGDEGWRFVPKHIAEERTNEHWGSRDFFNIFAFHSCCLMLNFVNGERYQQYTEMQRDLNMKYCRKIDDYFNDFKPQISGVLHGPLIVLENSAVMRFLLNSVIPDLDLQNEKNKSFFRRRDRLIDTLNKLSSIELKEINILEQMIKKSMAIPEDTADIEKTLETFERSLTMSYTEWINKLLIVIAFVQILTQPEYFIALYDYFKDVVKAILIGIERILG
jgi:hypothetical protein